MAGRLSFETLGEGTTTTALAILTTAVLLPLITIAILTRRTTGESETKADGGCRPFMPGYWLPFLGHTPQMAWNAGSFLSALRDRSPLGVFTLQLSGRRHAFIHNPHMVDALLQSHDQRRQDEVKLGIRSFGQELSGEGTKWQSDIISNLPSLSTKELLIKMIESAKVHIVDLITFNTYPSDQMEWERQADADIIETPEGERFVEIDLVQLVKNFLAKTANPVLFGPDLDKNFEDIPQLLWDYEALFEPPFSVRVLPSWLAVWLPRPTIQRAKRAQRVLLSYLQEYHEAEEKQHKGEDPGYRWHDIDRADEAIKKRNTIFFENQVPIRARAVSDLSLLRAVHAKTAPLTFWMLYEILRDPVLHQQIREEIAPYVKAGQPKNEFNLGVWVPPTVTKLDLTALLTECSLLRSAYVEALRLYTASWSVRRIEGKPVVLKPGEGDGAVGCILEDRMLAVAPHGLHQMDPRCFPEPKDWQGARHVKDEDAAKPRKAEPPSDAKPTRLSESLKAMITDEDHKALLGTIQPYGKQHKLRTPDTLKHDICQERTKLTLFSSTRRRCFQMSRAGLRHLRDDAVYGPDHHYVRHSARRRQD
jgi:cytochrome P450